MRTGEAVLSSESGILTIYPARDLLRLIRTLDQQNRPIGFIIKRISAPK